MHEYSLLSDVPSLTLIIYLIWKEISNYQLDEPSIFQFFKISWNKFSVADFVPFEPGPGTKL